MTTTGQLDFIDILSIASFCIGLANLEENLTQGDKQDLQDDLSNKADMLLKEIHKHLEDQDIKLNLLIQELEELRNDRRGNL